MSLIEEAQTQLALLAERNRAFAALYPGERAARQPVHTVYGGAQLFRADTTQRLGELARQAMRAYSGGDGASFARAAGFLTEAQLGSSAGQRLAQTVYERVLDKLQREPIEDFRIDFEDGFGARPEREEDETAVAAARQVALGLRQGSLPPFLGIRIKAFSEEWVVRAARTLELFLDTLLGETGALPPNFVVTLPKITLAEQARTLVRLFEILERRHGLAAGSLRMEIMIEITQALLGPDGRSPLPEILSACEGRCSGAHLGTYDFTASCNITASEQRMDHPWCDLAKGLMVLAYAGTGVFLSDGSTNVLPVELHRAEALTPTQLRENRDAVHAAWRLSQRHIRHSLVGGFYQGWDLHPAQLPVRFATCYAFFLEGFAQAAERLRNFIAKAAQATLVGDVFDDAATGQGLLNYFLRALNCGAISEGELAATGLSKDEVALRSFAKILAARRGRSAL
jgi:citrate lyase beta subunit